MTATTKLPSYSRNTKRYRKLRSFLDRLRADYGSEPLAWIALPTLAVFGRPGSLDATLPTESIQSRCRSCASLGAAKRAGVVGPR